MWKDYSWQSIRNNRSYSISVMVAAFLSALMLSLLGSLFYNLWKYEVDRLEREEGAWQGRLVGELDAEDLAVIQNHANVKEAVLNTECSQGREVVVDILLEKKRRIFTDMPRIAGLVGVPEEAVDYHYALLSLYLIRSDRDPAPRLIFPAFLAVTLLACLSLVMIIHNSFALSMDGRIHQFGILSSVGATPGQIRLCLLQEAAALCSLPILSGGLLGIGISVGMIRLSNRLVREAPGRVDAVWSYHPLVLLVTLTATILTIGVSAWIPARRLSVLTPLEAVRNTDGLGLFTKKRSPILSLAFGIEGELAGNALKARRKALRTADLSLACSFMAFTLMECFFTLSDISTRMSYFEAYQDAWDIMVTVKDGKMGSFDKTEEIQTLSGVRSGIVYQRAAAGRILTEDEISEEMAAFGGFGHAPQQVEKREAGFLVNVPLLILDDESFLDYCRQIGATPRLDGAVILNRIRDVTDPDFRHPVYCSYLKEGQDASTLCRAGQEEGMVSLPVIAYTKEPPVLREEYGTEDPYELVHFLPVSLWRQIGGGIGGTEEDLSIRILAEKTGPEDLAAVEEGIEAILGQEYEIVMKDRIREKRTNDRMIGGMKAVFGGFCILLALIGIGNVFSDTLGFVRQRKREFARYLSVGLTPQGLGRMFFIEALSVAGRPVLITLPLTVIAAGAMIKASYLEPMIFIREAPVAPILAFFLAVSGFVALAYRLGWKMVDRVSLAESLRDDTMT